MQINSASSSRNMLRMRPLFHSGGSPQIRSPTFAVSGRTVHGEITENVVGRGIHLSNQIDTDLPSPILHNSPADNSSRPDNRLRHANDGLLPNFVERKSPLEKYFSFIINAAKLFGYWISHQHCFARRALLKLIRSRNLIPYFDFDFPIGFQLIQ